MQNEIADTLILFNTNLIGLQVKPKKELKSLSEKTDVDLLRIHKRIADGIMQLGSVREALQANEKLLVKNKIGIEIELNTKIQIS